MSILERITVDPLIRSGSPTVRGTRMTVGDVLGLFAAGASFDEVLADFPHITRDDVLACFAFAAQRERRFASV
jgi:uncharacterized protein (DUF433 family)